ncbi:hypothetical protein [Hydrogenophaga sp. RWCD_12]|uniref:hypothetical protein n=1 Tax=Hydrogenophaga sp. RWCD_12 TaxID=3391190 RepID=UPI00398510DC
MNPWLIAAGLCTLLIGVVHSVMGEQRIFRHLRQGGWVPTQGEPLLREYQLRIVWGSWHLVTCFGLGVAALLFLAARPDVPVALRDGMVACAVGVMLLAAALVALATRGRHPAWLALSLTSAVALLGIS